MRKLTKRIIETPAASSVEVRHKSDLAATCLAIEMGEDVLRLLASIRKDIATR